MTEIRIGGEHYGLTETSLEELLRRVRETEPADHDHSDAAQSLEDKFRAAADSGGSVDLDRAELALLGIVIEAWSVELGTDAADVESIRDAISDELG